MLRRPVPNQGQLPHFQVPLGWRYFVVVFRVPLRRCLRVRVPTLASAGAKQRAGRLLPCIFLAAGCRSRAFLRRYKFDSYRVDRNRGVAQMVEQLVAGDLLPRQLKWVLTQKSFLT